MYAFVVQLNGTERAGGKYQAEQAYGVVVAAQQPTSNYAYARRGICGATGPLAEEVK